MSLMKISNVDISVIAAGNLMAVESYNVLWKSKASELPSSLLVQLRNIGAFESIGSSNRIEGNTLTDKEIEEILQGLKTTSFKNRDEEEVGGYSEVLDTIYSRYDQIPLTENYIKQLHGMLLRYVGKDERHRGEYKTIENSVAAFDNTGKEIGIVFRTPSPFETPIMMQQLVAETNELLSTALYPKLIVIALFIVHFLAIHPFQDGNGRMSRILTNYLLLRCGYSYVPYYSLEKIIEENKAAYYRALRQTQVSFKTDSPDYRPWIDFFSSILVKQTEMLEEKISAYKKGGVLKTDEQIVLDIIRSTPRGIQFAGINNACDMKENSIRRVLKTLLEQGFIEKTGTGKGTWYMPHLK